MSRYRCSLGRIVAGVKADTDDDATIGFDPGLETIFVQSGDWRIAVDGEQEPEIWLGTSHFEITSMTVLLARLAAINVEIIVRRRSDICLSRIDDEARDHFKAKNIVVSQLKPLSAEESMRRSMDRLHRLPLFHT